MPSYCDIDAFSQVVIEAHPHSPTSWTGELDRNPFEGTVKRPHKVQIARTYTRLTTQAPQQPELLAHLTQTIAYLRSMTPRPEAATPLTTR